MKFVKLLLEIYEGILVLYLTYGIHMSTTITDWR